MFYLPPQIILYEVQTPTSQDGAFVFNSLRYLRQTNEIVYTYQSLENRFNSLVSTWKQDTEFSSSVSEIVSNKAYLQIIALGEKVLPLIFKSMEQEPNHWFVALTSITGGVNPIKPEHRGNLSKMTEDWLDWAKKHYVAC
ncbi:MAG: hypothetical protein WC926_04895 [Candidatus Paceibacterota bacterium]|jgi:hypothetical protein